MARISRSALLSLCLQLVNAIVSTIHIENLGDLLVTRFEENFERNGRTPREAIVFLQIDRLAGQLMHVKRPEHVRNRQPDLAFGDNHSRADPTAEEPELYKRTDASRMARYAYPAPNIQWSR
jgi:hypothetical protein